jgi:hypothetical protein
MLPEMGERDRAGVGVRGGGACGKRVVAKTVDGSAPGGTSISACTSREWARK